MHPKFLITINGAPVSGPFLSLLKSITVNDKEGTRSDSVEIDLNDGPPKFNEIPDKDAIIKVWGGYVETGMTYFGAFSDADVNLSCLPYGMQISAKAADMKSGLKKHQERHWDGKTLGDVFGQLAGENGLAPQLAADLASISFPNDWIGMQNESVLHFGQRICERVGGLFAIKDGKLIMAEKGKGESAAGAAMGALTITPDMIVKGTCKVHFSAREKVKEVKAEYQDKKTAQRVQVVEKADSNAKHSYTIRQPFGDEAEAKRAAKAKAKELGASADTTSVTIEGNISARGGAPMSYADVRPGVDGTPFIIETAAHTFSKAGYTTNIDAKIKK